MGSGLDEPIGQMLAPLKIQIHICHVKDCGLTDSIGDHHAALCKEISEEYYYSYVYYCTLLLKGGEFMREMQMIDLDR